jgi:hypothetical protein
VLRELQANMPDASELEALHTYLDTGGDPAQLGRAEQLFVALRGTARLEQKLQVRPRSSPPSAWCVCVYGGGGARRQQAGLLSSWGMRLSAGPVSLQFVRGLLRAGQLSALRCSRSPLHWGALSGP